MVLLTAKERSQRAGQRSRKLCPMSLMFFLTKSTPIGVWRKKQPYRWLNRNIRSREGRGTLRTCTQLWLLLGPSGTPTPGMATSGMVMRRRLTRAMMRGKLAPFSLGLSDGSRPEQQGAAQRSGEALLSWPVRLYGRDAAGIQLRPPRRGQAPEQARTSESLVRMNDPMCLGLSVGKTDQPLPSRPLWTLEQRPAW